MKHSLEIPNHISQRLNHFETEVKYFFSFLSDYGYALSKTERGRETLLLDYYSNFVFNNEDTKIYIRYNTDILNGSMIAFPDEERPFIDNLISCNIIDSNAHMDISQFCETTQPEISTDNFSIGINVENINNEISRVLKNYSEFFQKHLVDVLNKDKIYDCYTDRFYDKVFKEKHYR